MKESTRGIENMDYDQFLNQILNWIRCAFGDHVVKSNTVLLTSDDSIQAFINSGNCMLLEVYQTQDNALHCQNSISFPPDAVQEIHFIKSKPEPYSPKNPVKISSMLVNQSSPGSNLLTSIKHVYGPLLQQNPQDNPMLQNLLSELESGLMSFVAKEKTSTTSEDHLYFLTPQEEFFYWYDVAGNQMDRLNKLGQSITAIVKPTLLHDEFDSLGQRKLEDVLNGDPSFIEKVVDVLDIIWLDVESYSQKRMSHLLATISSSIGRFVQLKCEELNMWSDRYTVVKATLERSLELCYEWSRSVLKLTKNEWPHSSGRSWKGEEYTDEFLTVLIQRLEEILRIRTSCEQVVQTLSQQSTFVEDDRNDESQKIIENLFAPFSSIHPLHITSYSGKLWGNAVLQFETSMIPIEKKIAGTLKEKLGNFSSRPMMLVHIFQQHKELILRHNIFNHLAQERSILLGQLRTQFGMFQNEYHDLAADKASTFYDVVSGRTISGFLSMLLCIKQIQDRIEKILWVCNTFLHDLTEVSSFIDEVDRFFRELDDHCQREFNQWMQDISKMGTLQLENTNMISMDSNKKMVVNYNEKLVSILQEVPQLSALGFDVPGKIINMSKMAEEFYTQAVILKQIANFYNNAHTQVIPSQSEMLVDAASNFERVIFEFERQRKAWSRINGERYISQLKVASEIVTSENRKLRKYHAMVHDKVIQLFTISLLSDREMWMEKIKEIDKIFKFFEVSYNRTDKWIDHWDVQIYKALEHQYQMCLETLNENLQEIRVDLVFKEKKIQFNPSFEKIKEIYFEKMKEFISFPESFGGLGKNHKLLYKQMIFRNYDGLKVVYSKAHNLFGRLFRLKKRFLEHVQLGMAVGESNEEMETLVRENVADQSQWEANFKMLKEKGKEVERIENLIRIDCITVSTLQIKASLDDQLQRLGQSMVKILKEQTQSHLAKISDFIISALEVLHKDPQSMDEIGQSHSHCRRLAQEKKIIFLEFDKFDRLNRNLRSVAGVSLDSSSVRQQWNDFGDKLSAHEIYLKDRTSSLRKDTELKLQAFTNELLKFNARWHEFKPKNTNLSNRDQSEKDMIFIRDIKEELRILTIRTDEILRECEYFGVSPVIATEKNSVPLPIQAFLSDVSGDISSFSSMWSVYEDYRANVENMEGREWLTFKKIAVAEFDDFLTNWNVRLTQSEVKNSITAFIRDELDGLSEFRDVIKFLQGDGWIAEHWTGLFRILSLPVTLTLESLTFGDLLQRSSVVLQKLAQIKELNERAQGEDQIRKALQEVKIWASNTEFNLYDYTTTISSQSTQSKRVSLIREWKEVLTQVGDNQSLLQSLKDSRFITEFAVEISTWEEQMITLDSYLHSLNQIQRKWIYLEPIFQRGSLPSHQQVFGRVDKEFQGIMSDIDSDKRVIQLAKRKISDILKKILDQLEICQKALNAFLEEKRSIFPRFYFIGDDDLLEILGQSQNPDIIQAHLKKLFAGIHTVGFDNKNSAILTMNSSEGECVHLKNPVKITEKVEEWLLDLDKEMRTTLQLLLVECENSSDFLIGAYPSQVLCLSAAISFTKKCEYALTNRSLDKLLSEMKQNLNAFTSIDTRDNTVLDLKVKSLILDLIHNIDVVESLLEHSAVTHVTVNDWLWQKQLRFYMQGTVNNGLSVCVIRMCNAQFAYTYEYQGNVQKLVHTPLTDKCYLTLTQGMHLGYGGNPYGPAGTGKTESVKALGHLFGRQVLVFNCDEGIDFKSMGRIFIGLVKCGAWGCFDEFNRLKEDQLSAVSQQIQIIQAAIKEKRQTPIEILGKQVVVDLNAGIFVTLNPAGKGYGGRSKLPDNLKQLFRSVAMAAPDNDLIAEVILYSEGFQFAKELGKKLVAIFTLSKQLLSPQQHYDWGLRALKAVLRVGGGQIQLSKKNSSKMTKQMETEIIIKALRVNTLSKLTYDDGKIFDSIVRDVFPGVDAPDISYLDLETAIKETLTEMNLIFIESQMKKMLQFYEAARGRMGVVLVGPSGSGKGTVWRVVKAALDKLGKVTKTYIVNPKAMPRQQLLGHMDMDTREWSDGIITANSRKIVKESFDTHSWIVCDGDVDPEWIESLNSVLDDNHLLTMPNGERIQFGSNVNFIFETHSLQYASPATVSRMGMIFLSEEDVDVKSLVAAWTKQQTSDIQIVLSKFIDLYFYRAIDILMTPTYMNDFVVDTTTMGIVLNALSHLYNSTDKIHYSDYGKGEFTDGLIRGLGSILPLHVRSEFAREIFELCGESPVDIRRPLDSYYSRENGCFISYSLDSLHDGHGLTFDDLFRHPMIQTVDVQRSLKIIDPWLRSMEPFVVVGPEGCGKNMLLHNAFEQVKNTQIAVVHCNSQTSAIHIIQKLNQTCGVFTTNSGKVLRPKDRERLILYLKDLNLPKPDTYGTTQLISFIQQLLTYKGYYDSSLEWISLEKIQIVASMNPGNSLGRYAINPRLTSIIRFVSVSYSEKDQLQIVFNEILKTTLSKDFSDHSTWKLPQNINLLTQAMVDFYDKVVSKFTIDEQAHYQFTPRDLTSWMIGLLNYQYSLSTDSPTELLDVIIYEARRIFRDRLVDNFEQYDSIEASMLRHFEQFGYVVNSKAEPFIYTSLSGITPSTASSLLKVQKESSEGGTSAKKALVAFPIKKFATVIQIGIKTYERDNRKLRIFLISEYAEFIARVDRVLSQPSGSLLLVGRPGTGRKNAVVLVSHLLNFDLITPNMSLGYGVKNFRNDLKQIMQVAGIQDKPVVFLIEDFNLTDESILESLNSLLSSGDVSGLFSPEEYDQMLPQLREQSGVEYFDSLYSMFVARVKKNLRIVLIMDPTNTMFLSRCQSNPAIYTKCSIQWNESFSRNGYARIPTFSMPEIMKTLADTEQKELVRCMLMIHDSISKESSKVTPLDFIRFVDSFKHVFNRKKDSKLEQLQHLQKGLAKLNEAAESVDKLSKEAVSQKKLLAEKQIQKEDALKQIQISMEQSVKETTIIQKIQEKITEEESVLNDKRQAIQKRLSTVQPILESAQQAVGKLKPESLNEIKALGMPPAGIRDILEGVLRLMGQTDTSWKGMKKFLSGRGVISQILTFDARAASPKDIDEVSEYLKRTASSFQEENARRSSVAAAPLAKWVLANVEYATVLKQVGPMEAELNELNESQERYKQQLQQCESKLENLNTRITELQNEFQKMTDDAAMIKLGVQKAENTLGAAQNLLSKLSGERNRWSKQNDEETKLIKSLPKLVLMVAAFITYLPHTSEDLRKHFTRKWLSFVKISDSTEQEFDLKSFMSTESELLRYKSEGLPGDDLSMENAISILNSVRYPLIIDPSQQATEWLHTNMMDKSVETTNPQDPKFGHTLELAVRFGKTLFIKEIDTIDPVLYPLLRQEVCTQGTRKSVRIGEKVVDYSDDFKLFLITRNPDIVLTPDSESLVTRVNFTVTKSGLEGQLLGITIQSENPELEAKKSELLKKEEENKIQLADLERQLLNELANSKGDILENVTLINKLTEIKKRSQIIMDSLVDSNRLKQELDQSREAYRPFAHTGSRLYFLVEDLNKVNHMYQFSLAVFLTLFKQSLISTLDKAANLNARIALLSEELHRTTFDYFSRSLFKEDRLSFAMHLVHGLLPELFNDEEWNFFLGSVVKAASTGSTSPKWVPTEAKTVFNLLLEQLPDLAKQLDFSNDAATWERWLQVNNAYAEFPSSKKVSPFQQLLVIKVLRPEQLYSAMTQFVCKILGVASISSPALKLETLFKDLSSNQEPILLITTPGTDPSQELEEMASRTIGSDNFLQIAMGGGQINQALMSLRRCCSSGQWLCLKNLHLVVSWLPVLEKELSLLIPSAHPNFRLWLTTEVHENFPIILLQQSLKITFESPPGIKQNMLRTFDSWDSSLTTTPNNPSNTNPKSRLRILFALSWFHALVQERRSFIPQGWSKFYEFSMADLRSASDVIEAACSHRSTPDWPTIHGLLENAIYGGRIDNDFDNRVLRAYLLKYFNDNLLSSNIVELSKGFAIPSTSTHVEFTKKIHSLSDVDHPLIFGLPSNSDKLVQISRSNSIVDSLKALVLSPEVTNFFNKEQWATVLNPIIIFWQKISDSKLLFTQNEKQEKSHEHTIDPLQIFVSLELKNARVFVKFLDRRIKAIDEAIKGSTLISGTIQSDATALISGIIPEKWQERWEHGPSTQIQLWLTEVINKTSSLIQWHEKSSRNALLAQEIELSGLFNPNIFLNAFKQLTARKINQPLDSLDHLIVTVKDSKNQPYKHECSILLKNLLMQGASFDGVTLTDQISEDDPPLISLPLCEISWISDATFKEMKVKASMYYMQVPVYFSATRERLLTQLVVPCGYAREDEQKFTLSGCAFFVNQ